MLSVELFEFSISFYIVGNFNKKHRLLPQPSVYYRCIKMDMNVMDAIVSDTLDPYPACTTKVSHGCANIININSKFLETRLSVKNNVQKFVMQWMP